MSSLTEDDANDSVVEILDVDDATDSSAAQVMIGVQTRKCPSLDNCRNSQYGSAPSLRCPIGCSSAVTAAFWSHLGNLTEILSLLILMPNSV